jgi:hypothetical protein
MDGHTPIKLQRAEVSPKRKTPTFVAEINNSVTKRTRELCLSTWPCSFSVYLRRRPLKPPVVTTLTTHVVQGTKVHIRGDIKFRAVHIPAQLFHQNLAISVKNVHRALQHFEVKSRSQELAVAGPALSCGAGM